MLFPPLTLVRKTMASYYSPGHDWTGRKDLTNCGDIVRSCSGGALLERAARVCLKCLQPENMYELTEQHSFMRFTFQMFFCPTIKTFLLFSPSVTLYHKSTRLAGWHYFWAWVWTCRVTVRHCSKMFPKHEWPSKVRALRITAVIFRNTFCFLIARLAVMLR